MRGVVNTETFLLSPNGLWCRMSSVGPNPTLGRPFRRLEVRLSTKKAALAIAHTMLVIVYHLLALGRCYEARYDQGNPRQEACERQRALKALECLGSTVTVERAV